MTSSTGKQKIAIHIFPNILRSKDNQWTIEIKLVKRIKHEKYFSSKIMQKNRQRDYNPWQNIWNKIEKSSKTGQDKESLISAFACFFTAIAKV